MTLSLNLSPQISQEQLCIIVRLWLLPKPSGVHYDYFYQVTPGMTFGFSRNPAAKGFSSKFNTAYKGGFFRGKFMSKIARYAGNLKAFGSEAQGLERTLFGETTQADDLTSQITSAFLRGWGVVGPSEHPSREDFNAAMYATSQFIAYQHQMGVPEWDAKQEYYIGSVCSYGGELYQSLVNSNIGSQPPSSKWSTILTGKNNQVLFASDGYSLIPVGSPVPWTTNNIPSGWIKCNGASFTAAQYPMLALAYPSLRLPDLRGEFIRGWDDGKNIDRGRVLLSSQDQSVQQHSHDLSMAYSTVASGKKDTLGASPNVDLIPIKDMTSANSFTGNAAVYMQANATTGTETRPRNIAFNYIVRAA